MRSFLRPVSLALAVLTLASCGDDPVTTITAPTPDPVTEVFSGSMNVNGAATHPFPAAAAGALTATLTGLGPEEDLTVGLSLGTWNGSACTTVIAQDNATRTSVVYGTVTQAGLLCVRIYDSGRLTAPVDYEITVVRP